ncbi:MAG: GNAT family N-acetyltransferase [Eubacteriales bacterium]|nr:GNAT family N-acetyltransferase [Eubacteriales bacterium]
MEFVQAKSSQEAEILDFINYVFSQSKVPHDFKKLLPFVYNKDGFSELHFVAEENGRIKGTVALLPFTLRVGNAKLNAGFVGSVSVHPYERGRGIMKALMDKLDKKAQEEKLDLVFLGGRRHRYMYFGYERCGTHLMFNLNGDSLRHALYDVDEKGYGFVAFDMASDSQIKKAYDMYLQKQKFTAERDLETFKEKAKSQFAQGYVFTKGEEALGYIILSQDNNIEEMSLEKKFIRPCLKSAIIKFGDCKAVCPAWDTELFMELQEISEGYQIFSRNMLRVYNWERVLNASLQLKQKPLKEGRVLFEIENAGTFYIEINKENAKAYETQEKAEIKLTQEQTVRLLFSPVGMFDKVSDEFFNWLPLPMELAVPDGF